ncbi:MAG: hypothetical protein F6K41_20235 [Symploca sp. SIO3E6]|nr:hypothetical protein [Caldora sp. SIO3E6]
MIKLYYKNDAIAWLNVCQYCSVKRVWGVWGVWEVWEERKRGRGIRAYPSSIAMYVIRNLG